MAFTTIGVSGTAIVLGTYGNVDNNTGSWSMGVGTGSAAVSSSRSGLVTEFDRNTITGSADLTTINKVSMTSDFTSVEMSGTNNLTEFGIFPFTTSGGKAYHVEGFTGVNFDGTQELQVDVTWRCF